MLSDSVSAQVGPAFSDISPRLIYLVSELGLPIRLLGVEISMSAVASDRVGLLVNKLLLCTILCRGWF